MAVKKFYHDIDLNALGQLVNARRQVVTTTERNDLALTLGAANEGLFVWDSVLKTGFTWDGTTFVEEAVSIDGDVVFKGLFDASIAIDAAGQPQTIDAVAGHQYVVSVAGTFDAGTSGITLNGNQALQVGDKILFTSETEAYAFQTNIDSATETTEGTIRLATQTDVDTGTDALAAVTSATLQSKLAEYARSFTSTVSVVAGTPLSITHGLALADMNGYVVNAMLDGSAVSVDVDTVDANTITVGSLVDLTNLVVTITGK